MKTKTPNVSGRSAWLRDNITKYFSFSAIIILLVALSLTQDNFLGTSNLKNLLRDTAPLMIMSAGMTNLRQCIVFCQKSKHWFAGTPDSGKCSIDASCFPGYLESLRFQKVR